MFGNHTNFINLWKDKPNGLNRQRSIRTAAPISVKGHLKLPVFPLLYNIIEIYFNKGIGEVKAGGVHTTMLLLTVSLYIYHFFLFSCLTGLIIIAGYSLPWFNKVHHL